MTGPEHYRTAEAFLAKAGANDPDGYQASWAAETLIAAASVHATLALAAAVGALDEVVDGIRPRDGGDPS